MCHTNGRCALQIIALLGCVCASGLDVNAQTPAGDRKIVTEGNKKDRQVEEKVIVPDPALDKPIGELGGEDQPSGGIPDRLPRRRRAALHNHGTAWTRRDDKDGLPPRNRSTF